MRNAKLIRQDVLFDKYGKKFIVDHLEHADGQSDFWAYVSGPSGVIVVALDKDLNLILVRQYRYTLKDFSYENPAGAIDGNESRLETARRELFEETGYQSDTFINLGYYHALTNETNHHTGIYLALNSQFISKPTLDLFSEKYCEMTTELHSFKEIFESLGKEDSLVKDTEHVAALFLAHKYLSDHNLL